MGVGPAAGVGPLPGELGGIYNSFGDLFTNPVGVDDLLAGWDQSIPWVTSTIITDPFQEALILSGGAPIGTAAPQPHSVPISYPESVWLRLGCWAGLDPDYVLPLGVEPPPRDSTDAPEGSGGEDSTAVNAASYFAGVFQCIGNVWHWYYTPW